MSRHGSCLCGAVTYTIKSEVHKTGACHCEMCRRWSGGVYLAVEVAADALEVTGSPKTYKSSDWAERVFCDKCGTSLWYRLTAPGPMHGTYHLGFGTLEDTSGVEFEGEIFVDKKPDAYSFAGDHSRMTEAEFMAMVMSANAP